MGNPNDGRSKRPRRQPHRFPVHIQKRATEVCKRALGNLHAISGVLNVWSRIVVTIILFDQFWPSLGWWPTYIACVMAMGCWQRGLATLLHESSHKRLAESKVLSFVCGTFCSGYLIFQGWNAVEESHGEHHVNLGDDEKDPDLHFLIKQGAYNEESVAAFAWTFLISPLLLLKTPTKIVDLVQNRFLSTDEPLPEKIVKFTYSAIIFGSLCALGYGYELLLIWFVPLLTTFPVVNWYLELFEHFPHVVENDTDLHMTRNRWTGWMGKFFLGVLNENYHQTHHLFAQCPYWRLRELHLILMEDPEYRATQVREIGLIFSIVPGVPSIIQYILNSVKKRSDSEKSHRDAA